MRLLVLLLALAHVSVAKFLTDREIESITCKSAIHQTIGRLTVSNSPTSAVDILRIPGDVSNFQLLCVQVFESLTYPAQATAAVKTSCQSSNPTLSICIAPSDATVSDANAAWVCSSLSQYLAQPETTTTYNLPAGATKMRIKLQWLPQLTTAECYPRDLTVAIVGQEQSTQSPSVAASVVFILIVVVVGIGIIVFAIHQVRRSMSHFKRGELERGVPLGDEDLPPGSGQRNDGDEEAAGNKFDDIYVDQPAAYTVTDNDEVLESRPMPKPWYQRNNYDLNGRPAESIARSATVEGVHGATAGVNDSRRLDFGSPGQSARRRHTPSGNGAPAFSQAPAAPAASKRPPFDDRGGAPRPGMSNFYGEGGNSLKGDDGPYYDSDDEEEEVLVCGDCGLEIHNKHTPQVCQLSGKRHR